MMGSDAYEQLVDALLAENPGCDPKFLAIISERASAQICPCIMTAAQVIEFIDMQDCHDMHVTFYDLSSGVPKLLIVHGPWYNSREPLFICLTTVSGRAVLSGYGTDH